MAPGFQSFSYFVRRRFIRIAPLYWAVTLVYAAKLSFQGELVGSKELIFSILFWPYSIANGLMRPVLGVGWTLNYEMFFYLVLGISLFFAKGWRLFLVTAMLLLLVLTREFSYLQSDGHSVLHALYLLSGEYLLFFIAGSCVAVLKEKIQSRYLGLSYSSALMLVVIALSGFIAFPGEIKNLGRMSLVLEVFLCAFCVFCCTSCRSFDSGLKGAVARLLTKAGDGSYSTYLIHGFVMGPVARLIAIGNVPVSPFFFAVTMVFVCSLVGILMFKYIETPVLRTLNERFGARV